MKLTYIDDVGNSSESFTGALGKTHFESVAILMEAPRPRVGQIGQLIAACHIDHFLSLRHCREIVLLSKRDAGTGTAWDIFLNQQKFDFFGV